MSKSVKIQILIVAIVYGHVGVSYQDEKDKPIFTAFLRLQSKIGVCGLSII